MARAKAELIFLYVRNSDIELQFNIAFFNGYVDVIIIIILIIVIIRIIHCNSAIVL